VIARFKRERDRQLSNLPPRQTPTNLQQPLDAAGVPVLGESTWNNLIRWVELW